MIMEQKCKMKRIPRKRKPKNCVKPVSTNAQKSLFAQSIVSSVIVVVSASAAYTLGVPMEFMFSVNPLIPYLSYCAATAVSLLQNADLYVQNKHVYVPLCLLY